VIWDEGSPIMLDGVKPFMKCAVVGLVGWGGVGWGGVGVVECGAVGWRLCWR